MKNTIKNFNQAIREMKTEDLINLQEGMMMLKTNKTSMSQIDLLEDVINERVKQKV